ncbi:hypothetical protein ABB37_01404 [Leptomonas pyrrhocoris]|uniref:Uncharacterized protein n=1 Tax=Leptomonas pyrrhocoris TaxID=157538 RepID=A0A0N0DZ73_LEPPY|nr:hypothetical protein ABB37_01404 [Leptomonas pyrrhocoris]KPA84965.1 hypothetical protein ABB37_01404 [Leptomonas pyrrhocoris]|eukprot:XP_015663404.1 hypothetical protein ABB37_01404 [Leptomonas pyrrhocoris]
MDVPVTSVGSIDDSRGLTTPECDSIEVKRTAASRWASVREALEACLDPLFLAGQSSVKDDAIVEELVQLLDTSLTAHVPALAGLSFLQPFFSGSTRSERLDAVLGAARASNKLMLRDDLPVPSSSAFMLSVDEAEAACLRVGPRSHAEGVNRSVLSLERKPHSTAADSEGALRGFTLSQLQASVPQHRIVKTEWADSPCAVRVVFVSPVAADRAYAVWRAHAPHVDVRVTRVGGAPTGKALPVPPRPAAAAVGAAATTVPAVPAPRTALKCPRVVGEVLSCPSSCGNFTEVVTGTMGTLAAAPRAAVPVPRPPPAIDAVLPSSAKSGVSAAVSSDPSTTSTTPSPESSTTKSKFNMNATPFLPKSVLEAQLAAATAAVAAVAAVGGSPAVGWLPRGSRPRRTPGCEEVGGAVMDTSEALANQMLMDSSSGWMYPGLDPYKGPAWANKFTALDGWAAEGNAAAAANGSAVCNGDMPSLSSTYSLRGAAPVMPGRPRAVGGDLPVAPCALGDSPNPKEQKPACAVQTRADLYQPPPMAMSPPLEQVGIYGAHSSPPALTSPANLSTSRRHRHDPYSPTGFVLCSESSCASSLSHLAGNGAVTPAANKLLVAGCLAGEKVPANFVFEDPLIKASARRRERRRQAQKEEGETPTSSSEADSSSTNLDGLRSPRAEEGCSSSSGSTGDAMEQGNHGFAAYHETMATTPEMAAAATTTVAAAADGADAAAGSHAAAPKSYAEALRLKSKAAPAAAVVAAKSPEPRKEKAGKATAAAAEKKTGAAASKAAAVSAVKPLAKPNKMAVVA